MQLIRRASYHAGFAAETPCLGTVPVRGPSLVRGCAIGLAMLAWASAAYAQTCVRHCNASTPRDERGCCLSTSAARPRRSRHHREDPPAAPPIAGSTSCPNGMITIRSGQFWLGSPAGEGNADEHPQLHAVLRDYCFDRTEVTVRAYRECVQQGGCPPPASTIEWNGVTDGERRLFGPACNVARQGADEHPMNCVDWTMAQSYCRWRGGRLPSEAEWEFAARGTEGRRYPWGGEETHPSRLNACDSDARQWAHERGVVWQSMYAASDGWATTAPVGSFVAGAAASSGALDMAGNVWEWTADWYADGYRGYEHDPVSNPIGPTSGALRVVRGGGWVDADPMWQRSAARGSFAPSSRSAGIGFRCAR